MIASLNRHLNPRVRYALTPECAISIQMQGCQILGFCPSNRIFQGGYAIYDDLHGFLREDSEGRGTLCARACAHMTLERGACASR